MKPTRTSLNPLVLIILTILATFLIIKNYKFNSQLEVLSKTPQSMILTLDHYSTKTTLSLNSTPVLTFKGIPYGFTTIYVKESTLIPGTQFILTYITIDNKHCALSLESKDVIIDIKDSLHRIKKTNCYEIEIPR